MRLRSVAAMLVFCVALSGCTHVKGVVVEEPSGHPLATAKFSIGRPGSMGVNGVYGVNSAGRFDFYVPTLDENRVFLYDSSGPAEMTMRRLESSELGQNMILTLRRARPGMLPGGIMQ